MSIGEQISKRLNELGLTQKELCDRTDIKKSAMSQYISNNISPPCDKVIKIAKALTVPSGWLLGDERYTEQECRIMKAYRDNADFRKEIDRVYRAYQIFIDNAKVGETIPNFKETVLSASRTGGEKETSEIQVSSGVFRVAQSTDGRTPPTHETMSDEKLSALREAPETDEDL